MPNQLHHVVMLSHSATRFIGFLTDVVWMDVQHSFRVPGEILETTLGWPPSEGADVTIPGSGMAGLIEVLDVPKQLRPAAPEGLAALSFMADDYSTTHDKAREFTSDITVLDAGVPGNRQGRRRDRQCRRDGSRYHTGVLRDGRRNPRQEADLR